MRIFGFEIVLKRPKMLNAVPSGISGGGGWFGVIREVFGGAFQQVVAVDAPHNLLAFSAVFACVTLIASDIAKLRIKLMKGAPDGFQDEVSDRKIPFLSVLTKPNHFQNRIQFVSQWIVSKLLTGNAYALKVRDARGVVTDLYVLDSRLVKPLVAETGDVYYELSVDFLSGVSKTITVPASEIIHDRMCCLWHPLIGVSPIYACAVSATMGNRIQANSTTFFQNMSRPSGQLTAPGTINKETADRLKQTFEEEFSGGRLGRLLVAGDGLKYEPMSMPAQLAQLIEQLKWTVEDVARCFHMPLYKIGAESGQAAGSRLSIESLNLAYYSDCLQSLIESLELCLDEGLGLDSAGYSSELDTEGLLRMDTAARLAAKKEGVSGGFMAPNEARAGEGLRPVTGGETPYLQQQNYSLAALAKRDALADPFGTAKRDTPPAANDEQAAAAAAAEVEALIDRLSKDLVWQT
jgi:HK97 family phage portal protein